jgi:hypothetical protein
MHKRISTLLVAGLAVAAVGTTADVATARQGADDPAGHVRHSRGADDPAGHQRHRAHHATTRGHVRHGHGADDGPSHT